MQETFELEAEIRADAGKGASRRLRRMGKVPAILYGGGKDPQPLTVDHNILLQHLEHEAFYSHILQVKIGDTVEKAVLKDVQRHPAKPIVLHIDLQRVSETDRIRMHVPIHFINEETAPGVKKQGGTVAHLLTEVDIVCMAKDLPEYIEVDLGQMKVGDSVHLSDLELPEGAEIPALLLGPEHDIAVVTINKGRGAAAAEEEEEGGEEEAGE
ncbi:MAG TPA: 50S ribosomal protein L25/general stress protein Ctc [Thiotrichales bacterium]|nr:50S ribosomal protein L25/general stress protein Ctc [Thiotrichales bacterium]